MLRPAMIRETVAPLADQVQFIRTSLGLSQNGYARRCGVHDSILSRLLNGKVVAEPSLKKVKRRVAIDLRVIARKAS